MHFFTFISTLSILSTATVVPKEPEPIDKSCSPIPLYRKRSRNPLYDNYYGHLDTTDKFEADDIYKLERKIATICSKQANGTVPLYKEHSIVLYSSYFSSLQNTSNSERIGYVYKQKQEGKDLFEIFRNWKTVGPFPYRDSIYLTTSVIDEGKDEGYTFGQLLFWSLPLEASNYLELNFNMNNMI